MFWTAALKGVAVLSIHYYPRNYQHEIFKVFGPLAPVRSLENISKKSATISILKSRNSQLNLHWNYEMWVGVKGVRGGGADLRVGVYYVTCNLLLEAVSRAAFETVNTEVVVSVAKTCLE